MDQPQDEGEVSACAVTRLGSGVNGAVRRLATTYNTQGLPEKFTSYDAATPKAAPPARQPRPPGREPLAPAAQPG